MSIEQRARELLRALCLLPIRAGQEAEIALIAAALAAQSEASAAAVPEDVRCDAERWRFLKNECTDRYGDGYSEPREAHLCLEWQQGSWIRDGSNGGRGRPDTFPGWDAIVDEMIARAADELAALDADDDDVAAAPAPEG